MIMIITVTQKCYGNFNFTQGNFNLLPGNFNLLKAISTLLTAISVCSWQFQFLTAISICSRQFQFTHSNFNFLTANNAHGIFRFAHHVKTQNQKSIFKVDLQSEKWKSKIESRFTNTYASRQWVDNRRVYWSQKIIKNYLTLTWWPVNIYCTASQNGSIPHINPSIDATSKSSLLMLLVAVLQ